MRSAAWPTAVPARPTRVSWLDVGQGGRVGRPHLVAGQDGEHGAARSATTKAMATSVVWVNDRWKVPAPDFSASAAAPACRTRRGRCG